MSAWLLNKYEIDVLVHWLHKTGVSRALPDDLGKTLWSENYKSIRYRYDDNVKRPSYTYATPKARHYPRTGKFFDPEDMDQALRLCHFYNYQSCEHPTYEESRANRMISKLAKYLDSEGADWQADNIHWGEPHGGYIEEDAKLLSS